MSIRTYQDAVEYLIDAFQLDSAAGRTRRTLRKAVDEAYREIPYRAPWAYFRRSQIINTVASQSTGTIAYTHSSRTVTLTGSTFPSDVIRYRLIIGQVHYDIDTNPTSTTITLPVSTNPGADVASGTSYTIYRSEYELPDNFRRAIGLWNVNQRRAIQIIEDAVEQEMRMGAYGTPGNPWWAALRNTGEHEGTLSLIFSPPPNTAQPYDMMYESKPRAFVTNEKYSTGTVTTSAASAVVTGSGTTFPNDCRGCVFRLSGNSSDEPTGPFGAKQGDSDIDNPPVFESTVLSRDSATQITLNDAVPAVYTDCKYTLSDPIDMEQGAMMTAFLRLTESAASRLLGRDDREERRQAADRELIRAKECDSRSYPQPEIMSRVVKYGIPITSR